MLAFGSVCRQLSLVLVVLVPAWGLLSGLPHTHCPGGGADRHGEAVLVADHGGHAGAGCPACAMAAAGSATLAVTAAVGHGGWTPAADLDPVVGLDLGLPLHLRARSPPSVLG